LAIPQHAKIERISNRKKALIHKLICRSGPLKSPTRLPEDPVLIGGFRSNSRLNDYGCALQKGPVAIDRRGKVPC
jgi:hypothetical protein